MNEERNIEYEGSVVWFNIPHGFGWIKVPTPGRKDIFFHIRDVVVDNLPPLNTGDLVAFNIKSEAKGPRAICVRRLTVSKGKDNGSETE